MKPSHRSILLGLLALFPLLGLAFARVMYPIDDEAFFASPAFNLITKGFFGTTVIESAGSPYKGLDQATYWIQPLHSLALAAWGRMFGFTLWSQRALSVAFGVIDLCCWFLILRALTRRLEIALLGLVLLSVNYDVLSAAAGGRMDMMSGTLAHAALAAYLTLRETSLRRALSFGFTLAVLAGLTHPLGGLLSLANLGLAIAYFDRTRLEWRHAVIVLAPFVIGGALWGTWIAQHPDFFVAQFFGNASDTGSGVSRLASLADPARGLVRFARNVLDHHYGAYGSTESWSTRIKLVIPLVYLCALVAALVVSPLRRQPGVAFGLLLFVAQYVLVALIEARLKVQYFFYVLILPPVLISLEWQWAAEGRRWKRAVFVAACAALLLVQSARIAHSLRSNAYETRFAPYVRLLERSPYRGQSFWGSAEWAYAVGFDNIVEDNLFGFYSGRKPRYIILETDVLRSLLQGEDQPRYTPHVRRIFGTDYRQVHADPLVTIWERHVP